MVQELEQEFSGRVIDLAIQEYRDARGRRQVVGSPVDLMMRNILSARKVGPETLAANCRLNISNLAAPSTKPPQKYILC